MLAFDGGGIRGYSTLLMLQAIMDHIRRLETLSQYEQPEETLPAAAYLPAHYFNYMVGTSTGGLIAIMLGRLQMNVDDALKEYENLGREVFGKPR
ncbi:FabD/lysophospholipase-like protein, partial [Hyaloscypha hepaticicola]